MMLFYVHDAMTFEQYRDKKHCFWTRCLGIIHQNTASNENDKFWLPAQGPYSTGKLHIANSL